MPATESTWYNMPTMHRIFAMSGVVLTLSTIWMFYKDHYRSWKHYQRTNVDVDVRMTRMREEQFQTDRAQAEIGKLEIAASEARALLIDPALVNAFVAELKTENKSLPDQTAALNDLQKKSEDAAKERQKASAARQAAEAKLDDAKLQQAASQAEQEAARQEQAAARVRANIVATLQGEVNQAQINETKTSGLRKFQSAHLDKAKADLDIGIRDSVTKERMKELQAEVDAKKEKLDGLTAKYQQLSEHRVKLQKTLQDITAPVAVAEKALADAQAAKKRLETAAREKDETYFVGSPLPIFPGKKFLNQPIIDAFMGRRKPDNLWSADLMQDYNFGKVRRFDRCTTCHGSMQKSLPGDPTSPAYLDETRFDLVVTPRTAEEVKAARAAQKKPEVDENGQPIPYSLEEYLGVKLADHGLLKLDDVVVKYVEPRSPGAAALPVDVEAAPQLPTGEEIQLLAATGVPPAAHSPIPKRAGLLVGDVLVAIGGSDLVGQNTGAPRAAISLVDLAAAGKPFHITISRGLPHPYNSHPRLDLFISDSSPHKLSTFACTICHEGQGSATDFKWASHTPNDATQAERWAKDPNLGWFNNHHWIYPMLPARFTEATCLKCHHDVVELEPSQKFPDPPAEKLMHGYHLIRKYGCYGCHEVNGYDGPTKRVGPDLRLEPNFFAVAQQFEWEAGQAASGEKPPRLAEMLELARTLADHPDNNGVRHRLMALIEEDQIGTEKVLPPQTYKLAGMLKDVDAPGTLRKPGPSLRFVKHKVHSDFLYDWIWNPKNFRPTTRMPRFFGLWDHLEEEASQQVAHNLEPIEARGLVKFLEDRSQNFEPMKVPEGVDEWSDEDRITRGKRQFETRGCLACHTHKDFPDTSKFRGPNDIVQGPDLSNVGRKFAIIPEDKEKNQKEDLKGPLWLYSWIKNPTKYHARTVMPNLFLEPEKDKDGKVFDPAEDITTWLLSDNAGEWQPALTEKQLNQLSEAEQKALQDLTVEYMNEAFFHNDVVSPDGKGGYYYTGLPEAMRADLKGAETELITTNGQLTDDQRLRYIGLKTVSKYGCYGCHDIPGFEDAKPIGTQLQNWGRKDPSRLAFEHISHYPKAVGAHGAHGNHAAHPVAKAEAEPAKERAGGGDGAATGDDHGHAHDDHAKHEELPPGFEGYYGEQLHHGSRIGFIYQKLQEPRSYDYNKTANKRFNERLRMPQFPFDAEDREAVITFVLGLVAEPPREKYLYRANPRAKAIADGKVVLEKFNCGGCHILEADKWKLSFTPGTFEAPAPPDPPIYPFLQAHFSPADVTKSATPDASNRLHATVLGLTKMTKPDGLPELVVGEENEELAPDERYDPRNVKQSVDLVQSALIGGNVFESGLSKVSVPGSAISNAYTGNGGLLTRYLLPQVTKIAQETNPNASGTEAYGWLPPPLYGEGEKVQSNWLFEFLLDPYPIRPAVFLRMPKFNMSNDEATKLVNYFAAVDNAAYPYEASPLRKDYRLADLQAKYAKEAEGRNRLDDAMKIVMDRKNFCAQCHHIADFDPGGNQRAKGPNLADVYRRLRPEYVRDWIANPKMILPYTGMPINIPYNPDPKAPGKASAHHAGNSEQQVEALVDLLMNYDQYAKGKNAIAPQIPAPEPAPTQPPATAPGTPGKEAGTGAGN